MNGVWFARPVVMMAIIGHLFVGSAAAQTARLSGFVTDRSDGQALEGATIVLYRESIGGMPAYGTVARAGGVYQIRGIQPGRYFLQVSFVGYRAHRDTLDLAADDIRTVTVALEPDSEALDEVVVEAGRAFGAAHVTAGHQRIRPEEIELIPAPDISADLANYLSTLPGVVTSGDRGGQFFVRGGEPSQNLVLLDGMAVYQPFHVLGFYSAFPSDIIDRVDLYAGGFGARYAGRLSSVIDVAARAGNNRRFEGTAAVSPFTGTVRFEGPIVPGRASFLVSGRESFIDRTGEGLYSEPMPFRFGDAFVKVQVTPSRRDRFSLTLLRTHDRGNLVSEITDDREQELRWRNSGGSLRWLMLPRSVPVAAEITASRSRHEMGQGPPGDTVRSSVVEETRIAMDATFSEGAFFGGKSITYAGFEVIAGRAKSDLGGLFQNVRRENRSAPALGLYLEPEIQIAAGLSITPGLRVQWYKVRLNPYFEPRMRVAWEFGMHHITGAAGLYHQQIVGVTDRRDAASVFTAWTVIPRLEEDIEDQLGDDVLRGRLGTALHALLGYRSSPVPWLEYSVEGFYKEIDNLFVGEWTAVPRFSTRLQPAIGRSIGMEVRIQFQRNPVYAYVTYGLSGTIYEAVQEAIQFWFGTEGLRYRPAHDRRHQVTALVSASWRGFDLSARWQFGSGLPYTRPLGFDRFALVDDIKGAFELEHSPRVIYERPFASILPTYHRLDVSVERTWNFDSGSVTLQASGINVYDRRNVFYVDVFTLDRKDQLPFIPSLGIRVGFE